MGMSCDGSDVLLQLVALFTAYFAEFSEAAIKNNFVLIYELLDEVSTMRKWRL